MGWRVGVVCGKSALSFRTTETAWVRVKALTRKHGTKHAFLF